MLQINTDRLIIATECVARHALYIDGGRHGSSWLFDKLMRFFSKEPAARTASVDIILNVPCLGVKAEAQISRTGDCLIIICEGDKASEAQ